MVHPGEKMKYARRSRRPKVTQTDLAELVGTNRAATPNYESKRAEPPRRIVTKMAYEWGIPEAWFWDGRDTPVPFVNAEYANIPQKPQLNLVPYWGEVPCGDWETPTSDPDLIQISDAVNPEGVVCVSVIGNSMLPRFRHGQKVVVKLTKEPIDGLVHLCHNQDGELTLKVVRFVGTEWQLHSINPEYGAVTAEKWTILGRAIHVEETDTGGLRP